jgi:tetratricopeptide (TPR) repeat protein
MWTILVGLALAGDPSTKAARQLEKAVQKTDIERLEQAAAALEASAPGSGAARYARAFSVLVRARAGQFSTEYELYGALVPPDPALSPELVAAYYEQAGLVIGSRLRPDVDVRCPTDAAARAAEADRAFQKGEPAAAAALWPDAIAGCPAAIDWRVRYADAVSQSGQPVRARDVLQAVVAEDPTHATAWRYLADLHLQMEDGTGAIDALVEAVVADPTSVIAWGRLHDVVVIAGGSLLATPVPLPRVSGTQIVVDPWLVSASPETLLLGLMMASGMSFRDPTADGMEGAAFAAIPAAEDADAAELLLFLTPDGFDDYARMRAEEPDRLRAAVRSWIVVGG